MTGFSADGRRSFHQNALALRRSMIPVIVASLLLLTMAAVHSEALAAGGWSTDFAQPSRPGMDGQVLAAIWYHGAWILSGHFSLAGGVHAWVVRWDGTSFTPMDTGLQGSFCGFTARAFAVYRPLRRCPRRHSTSPAPDRGRPKLRGAKAYRQRFYGLSGGRTEPRTARRGLRFASGLQQGRATARAGVPPPGHFRQAHRRFFRHSKHLRTGPNGDIDLDGEVRLRGRNHSRPGPGCGTWQQGRRALEQYKLSAQGNRPGWHAFRNRLAYGYPGPLEPDRCLGTGEERGGHSTGCSGCSPARR